MDPAPVMLRGRLGFSRAENVVPDAERPGLLRAPTLPLDVDPLEVLEYRDCPLRDCVDGSVPEPGLEAAGFECVDLSGNAALQRALAALRATGSLTDACSSAIRESVRGARFALSNGKRLRVEYVADDGMIHRRAGPNGLDVNPAAMDGGNHHRAALHVHADQDVFGTPLRQMMNGGAPSLFRHQTPDGRNDDSSLFLLNLWIPLQQITTPLVLMDRRTLDPKRHQLRYGLPVTRFLDRDEDMSVNDIWTFLPDPSQQWYFRSSMGPEEAYVFDTLGEPHGACVLPGEEALEGLYRALGRAIQAARAGDASALRDAAALDAPRIPRLTTEPIRSAWRGMTALLAEACDCAGTLCSAPDAWCERAGEAMDAVVRQSIEMRMAATLEDA